MMVNKKRFHVAIPFETYDWLKEQSENRGISIQSFSGLLLEECVKARREEATRSEGARGE